ncbi:MAG: hypothetical protein QOF77_2342 [Solirubrobacteraceae bacterium]|nr:hypothetical protein [Solirubrobacteraceae bacterium]
MSLRRHPVALIAGVIAGFLALTLLIAILAFITGAQQAASSCGVPVPATGAAPASAVGLREIPSRLMPLYRQAAATYALGPSGWAWLAAVNRIETDFGRDLATSSAGAIGWMQFEPATWAEYAVDGNADGRRDPYEPADAIAAAARYLRALGAPADWQVAIRGYNGGPGAARSPSTLGYWQSTARSAAAYLASSGAPAPAPGPDPAARPVALTVSPGPGVGPASASPSALAPDAGLASSAGPVGPDACPPCPAPASPQVSDTLVSYDPAAVPDARGRVGFTPRPGAVYTVGQEPLIASRLDALGRFLHLRLTGTSGYRSPARSVAVGGSARDPHTRGQASDTPGVEAVPEAVLEQFGLTRPLDRLLPGGGHTNPAEADHIQLLDLTPGALASAAAVPADQCAAGGAVPLAPGDRARIEPGGLAAAPASAPPAVRAMIAAGNQLIGRPYVYGGGHGGFTLAAGYDCSSSVSWALHAAGFLTAPQDSSALQGFGAPGAGLWVTVYANPGHAFVLVAGIRLDTSPQGGDGPWSQPGPRWRPATRSTAGFIARHPPGL